MPYVHSPHSTLVAKVKEICQFPNDGEAHRILSGLKWIGLFSSEKAHIEDGNLLDTLCAQLQTLMPYGPGERDLVMLQHKFVVEWADGKTVSTRRFPTQGTTNIWAYLGMGGQDTITSTLEAYGEPGGHSAMALYVGVPCGIAVQLVLDGVLNTPGVQAPYSKEICEPIRKILETEGIGMVERVL